MININVHVFQRHQEHLAMLSGALGHLEEQVYLFRDILDDLPPEIKNRLEKRFDDRITGVGCVCNCLATLTERMGEEAGDWALWALQTGTEIKYKPVQGGAI